MAASLQFPTTVVAQTGTGPLFVPYSQGPDQVIWTYGSGTTRTRLSLNRTQPKPTADFPGVDRLEFKTNQFYAVSGVEYQSVISLVTSIPVNADDTHRTAMKNQLIFMSHDSAWVSALTLAGFPT
jgi:hypothetical protein